MFERMSEAVEHHALVGHACLLAKVASKPLRPVAAFIADNVLDQLVEDALPALGLPCVLDEAQPDQFRVKRNAAARAGVLQSLPPTLHPLCAVPERAAQTHQAHDKTLRTRRSDGVGKAPQCALP